MTFYSPNNPCILIKKVKLFNILLTLKEQVGLFDLEMRKNIFVQLKTVLLLHQVSALSNTFKVYSETDKSAQHLLSFSNSELQG